MHNKFETVLNLDIDTNKIFGSGYARSCIVRSYKCFAIVVGIRSTIKRGLKYFLFFISIHSYLKTLLTSNFYIINK